MGIRERDKIVKTLKVYFKGRLVSITSTIKVEACNYRQDDDATIG